MSYVIYGPSVAEGADLGATDAIESVAHIDFENRPVADWRGAVGTQTRGERGEHHSFEFVFGDSKSIAFSNKKTQSINQEKNTKSK